MSHYRMDEYLLGEIYSVKTGFNRTYRNKKVLTALTTWTRNISKEIYCKCFSLNFIRWHIFFVESLKTFSSLLIKCVTYSHGLWNLCKINLKCKNFSTYNKLLVRQLHPNSLFLHHKVCFFRYISVCFSDHLWGN